MPDVLFITDLGKNTIQVSLQHSRDTRLYAEPSVFASPLTKDDQKQLSWYIEDYLDFPFGAEEWKAEQVEQQMAFWGARLFSQVFGEAAPSNSAYSLYQQATGRGLDRCELCVESADPAFLGIEWELLRDPSLSRGYLAPLLKGLYRRLPGQSTSPTSGRRKEAFRILLVIARPSNVSLLPIEEAQHILEVIRPLRPYIQIDALRPATLDALQEKLNAQPGYYQAVHFDGHGVFDGDKGNLVFEKRNGQADIVGSDALGQLLANSKVPLFILSACQTSQETSKPPYSSVASRLIATGVVGVVAMSYSVHIDAASRFMHRFYEALLHGATLSEAVAEGRRRLFAELDRQSMIGAIPLHDWIVPVLFQQRSGYTPLKASSIDEARNNGYTDDLLEQVEQACPEGRFGFVGRSQDILRIEKALEDASSPCVVLSGIGGTGKTELAYGFARWYAETGGCPGGVFATSFKHNASFGQVAASITDAVANSLTSSESDIWRCIVDYLQNNRCLLVWDNTETIDGCPEGEPLATSEDSQRLSDLLRALKGSNSRVIITTRRQQETWLATPYTLLQVGGLSVDESTRLANIILGTIGRSQDDYRNDEDYLGLLHLLGGHPQSIEVAVPRLRTRTPREIIDAIQHRIDTFSETLFDASLQYAFLGLSDEAQSRLQLLGVFASRVIPSVMAAFDKDWELRGSPFGPAVAASQWEQVLNEGADMGLLRTLPGPIYELHPTIAPFLRTKLSIQHGDKQLVAADMLYAECYAALSSSLFTKLQNRDEAVIARLLVDEDNFVRALRVAEQAHRWQWVHIIAQTVHEFYEYCCRWQEWRSLRRRLLASVGGDVPVNSEQGYLELSLYLNGAEANDAFMRGDLQSAEAIYMNVADMLSSSTDENSEFLAICHHHLGLISERRHRFEEAESRYEAALQIFERMNLEKNIADECLHLGIIAQHRGDLERAEMLYKRAIEIHIKTQSERSVALGYHQLSRIAEQRRQFNEAQTWCQMALEINERLGIARAAATNYHQLGVISQERKCYDDAENYYRMALIISDQAESPSDVAFEYLHLGIVAQDRKQTVEAEVWYQQALDICEELQDVPLAGRIYGQIGILRCDQGRHKEAVGLMGKAYLIALNGSVENLTVALYNLASLYKELGEEELSTIWRAEFGEMEPHLMDSLRKIHRMHRNGPAE